MEQKKNNKEEKIEKKKPFYFEGNNISYSQDFVKRYKSKILINTILYIWLIILCSVITILCGYFGLTEPAKYHPLNIVFWVFIGIDVIVYTFSILNFIFNHVYTKDSNGLKVALYCNWWCKILEINGIQVDFGSYKKVMNHKVNNFNISVIGKEIKIEALSF